MACPVVVTIKFADCLLLTLPLIVFVIVARTHPETLAHSDVGGFDFSEHFLVVGTLLLRPSFPSVRVQSESLSVQVVVGGFCLLLVVVGIIVLFLRRLLIIHKLLDGFFFWLFPWIRYVGEYLHLKREEKRRRRWNLIHSPFKWEIYDFQSNSTD